ncbi:MAG: Bug family tripartite tricarboxylate transporter substrate binding protein [Alphaproteobacteria bacterium]|jgi:tripartite-type tricarboxylate transporter receptor subunit TctC
MPKATMTKLASIAIGGVLAAGLVSIDSTASAEVKFTGRINAVIGSSPGGGTDGTTRLVGRFLEKYLPGDARIVYRNMPAGHGVRASNYFYNLAKRDGTVWMGGSSSYLDPNNLRKKVVKYNPTHYNYIGAISRGGSVIIMRKTKFKDLNDKSQKPVIIGTIDGSRSWGQMVVWGAEYLNWNVKFVVGYPGSSALALALRRGEIDAFGTSTLSMHKGLSKTGQFRGLSQLGELSNGKVVRRISFQDVPTMPALMKDKTSGLAKKTFDFWSKTNQIDKWYALPPKTPKEIVDVYRAAYKKVVVDPEFIKFGRFQFSQDFNPMTHADIADLVNSTSYPDPAISNFLRQIRINQGLPADRLSDAEMAKLSKKFDAGGFKVKGVTLDAVKRGGRFLFFKVKDGSTHKAKVSSSRTKIKVAGKKAARKKLKPGLKCDIDYSKNGGQVRSVNCN